jgi:hypothetical protein
MEAFLVIARLCLWVVVVSCLVTGCLESFSDRITIDPATVTDLKR